MAMTIGEASAVATVLQVITLDERARQNPPTPERLADDLRYLDQRAGKPLQVAWVVRADDLDAVARELLQRLEDAA